MQSTEFHYFKFTTALIDTGMWARMSGAARCLYPVLLRFSDRNFKPVFPGSQVLLKLTGFKQKSSLRKARQELIDLGLIAIAPGTGRKNTNYHFRFDWIPQGATGTPPSASEIHPPLMPSVPPRAASERPPEAFGGVPPYNQIHISIHNKPDITPNCKTDSGLSLEASFGEEAVRLARSECILAGIEPSQEALKKILYQNNPEGKSSWSDLKTFLRTKISSGSLQTIENAFLEERAGMFIFYDILPEHLKKLLREVCGHVFFEPYGDEVVTRGEFWKRAGNII